MDNGGEDVAVAEECDDFLDPEDGDKPQKKQCAEDIGKNISDLLGKGSKRKIKLEGTYKVEGKFLIEE